ncbi:hypothetical protein PI124_g1097 [Phytophthora idaei]|nr:hypothetical protein PI125_g1351 [Phytophthora idaei]KAG3142488.1 hypothetical protein PI126_g15028 [Phytophthora idaei]KAG3254399.1 hypothetical protein PI124_g1097 [Phytophthora idaei]
MRGLGKKRRRRALTPGAESNEGADEGDEQGSEQGNENASVSEVNEGA